MKLDRKTIDPGSGPLRRWVELKVVLGWVLGAEQSRPVRRRMTPRLAQ